MLDSETAQKRQIMFGDLEKEQEKLNGEVENLRQFEREYRSRLHSYFSQQLELLNSGETSARRARSSPRPSGCARSSARTTADDLAAIAPHP